MLEAVRLIGAAGRGKPVCLAVHEIFADRADALLAQAGARVVTSNSIPHQTNEIDVGKSLAGAVGELT
jgi:ribose-phosphate pyrophosphokinase